MSSDTPKSLHFSANFLNLPPQTSSESHVGVGRIVWLVRVGTVERFETSLVVETVTVAVVVGIVVVVVVVGMVVIVGNSIVSSIVTTLAKRSAPLIIASTALLNTSVWRLDTICCLLQRLFLSSLISNLICQFHKCVC